MATGARSTRKPVRKRKTGRKRPRTSVSPRFFWPLVGRLVLAGVVCFVGLLLYLDHQIQQSFEQGVHPQPAHLYSRAAELKVNGSTSITEVEQALNALGYRKGNKFQGPGSYVITGEQMDLHVNGLPGAENDSVPVRLEFRRQRLVKILRHKDGAELDKISLEPQLIGSLQLGPYEDRIALKLHQMPEHLIRALLVMEDRNFEKHIGIDLMAIGRALINNLIRGEAVQGGSTITQQLIKNLFLSPERSLSRKAIEALMAISMELRYSKAQILEHYLNEIFLGQAGNRAVHGFALASEYYFARPLDQLRLSEVALLVGMIPAPSYYNPHRHPGRALARRNLVLRTLAGMDAIHSSTANQLINSPLGVAPPDTQSGVKFPTYIDYLHRQIRQYFAEEVLRTDGLKLYTTLDPSIQRHTQAVLSDTLQSLEKNNGIPSGKLQSAAVVVDIASGDILALVGDRLSGFSGFNRAIDAQRPIGSLVKPLVYLTALEQPDDFSLATILEDTPLSLTPPGGEEWSPRNYDKSYRGTVNMLEALTRSYNVPTVRVGLSVGVNNIIETINRLGVERDIRDYPSLLLGANDHSPLEVAQLYQPIANHGIRIPLRSLIQIGDRRGKIIARFPGKKTNVIENATAYLIDYALKQVVRRGTAARLSDQFDPGLQLAGKTGTTDNYRDSWFAGYSGNLLTVVWVGRDDNKPVGLTGSSGAMRVWQKIMQGVKLRPAEFNPPEGIRFLEVDPYSGLLAKGRCRERLALPVLASHPVKKYAPCAGVIGRVQNWFNIDVSQPEASGLIGVKKNSETPKETDR